MASAKGRVCRTATDAFTRGTEGPTGLCRRDTMPSGWRLGEYRHRSVGARAAPRAGTTDDWNRRRCAEWRGPPRRQDPDESAARSGPEARRLSRAEASALLEPYLESVPERIAYEVEGDDREH